MSRNNDVSKVMVFDKAAAEVGDGTLITALAANKFGLFNYDTGKSVTSTGLDASKLPNNFFIAYMGKDDGSFGTPDEIYTSTGTHVQKRNLRYASFNGHEDAVGQEINITNTNIQSGPDATQYDYGFKLDFRGNTEVYQRFGYNQATKFFMADTRCVGKEGGTPVVYADAEVAAQWAAAIAADTDKFIGLFTDGDGGKNVEYVPVIYDDDAGVTMYAGWYIDDVLQESGDAEALALAEIRKYTDNLKFFINIQNFSAMYRFCDVNPKYFKQRQIMAIPSLIGGTCKWADIEETISMKYEQGTGYDINELEYLAGGFTGKPGPYRQSRLHGLAFNDVEYLATKNGRYAVSVLSYDQFSVGGWLEYLNNQSTYFVEDESVTVVKDFIKLIADAAMVDTSTFV